MVDLEENRDTGRYVEPLRRDRRESHLPAIREQGPSSRPLRMPHPGRGKATLDERQLNHVAKMLSFERLECPAFAQVSD